MKNFQPYIKIKDEKQTYELIFKFLHENVFYNEISEKAVNAQFGKNISQFDEVLNGFILETFIDKQHILNHLDSTVEEIFVLHNAKSLEEKYDVLLKAYHTAALFLNLEAYKSIIHRAAVEIVMEKKIYDLKEKK